MRCAEAGDYRRSSAVGGESVSAVMPHDLNSFKAAGYVEHYAPPSYLDNYDAAKLNCEACGRHGLTAVILRSESSQPVTFAACENCGNADELRVLQQADQFGRCPTCNQPMCLSILDKVECLTCENVKWNADLEAERRELHRNSRRRA